MPSLFHRLWHAMAGVPNSRHSAAKDALIRSRLADDGEPLLPDKRVTTREVRRALDWLLAYQPTRRARQRKRRAITYQQRDHVADILLRLARNQPEAIPMASSGNRETWIKAVISAANAAAVGTGAEGADFSVQATEEAAIQEDDYGDDFDQWEDPEEVAARLAADFPMIDDTNTNPEGNDDGNDQADQHDR